MSKTAKAFRDASDAANLPAQVQIARATARTLILEGGIGEDPHEYVNAVAGVVFDRTQCDGGGKLWDDYCLHINAALALGIAIGLLVHPDVFTTGGAR